MSGKAADAKVRDAERRRSWLPKKIRLDSSSSANSTTIQLNSITTARVIEFSHTHHVSQSLLPVLAAAQCCQCRPLGVSLELDRRHECLHLPAKHRSTAEYVAIVSPICIQISLWSPCFQVPCPSLLTVSTSDRSPSLPTPLTEPHATYRRSKGTGREPCFGEIPDSRVEGW